jgi:signal transduction histidine kinase/CHASE3 domain sensor protein
VPLRERHSGARLSGGLTGRMLWASALLALVVAAAFAVVVLAISDVRRQEQRLSHSQDVLVAANLLERLLLDVETGLRGFVLTGREQFLQPWQAARAEFPHRAEALVGLVADDPAQKQRATLIAQAGNAYIRDYSLPLVEAARRGDPAARSVAATAAGKQRVDALRGNFDQFIAAERSAAARSKANAESAESQAIAAGGAGLGGSVILIALYAAFLTRAIVGPVRHTAAMASRLAEGDLAARVPERGTGEIGALERAFNVMGSSLERSRDELAQLAHEQAALRRVATLVARGGSPPEVFSAVAEEIAQLLGASVTKVLRFEADRTATVVGGWSEPGMHIPIGIRLAVEGEGVAVSVLRTGRPARCDRFDGPPGSVAACFRDVGVHTGVGSPIIVEGELWGAVIAASARPHPLAPESENRVAGFTELVATAIANAQARLELRAIADEQAALRRVATLVARAAPPATVFAAVAEEVGRLLAPADRAFLGRYDADHTMTLMAAWSSTGESLPVGLHGSIPVGGVSALVRETGRMARVDASDPEVLADNAMLGLRSAVAAPITVGGRLWGFMAAASTGDEPPPLGAETRLAQFTELVATAIANAEAQAELTASRARIVATADETRRRIERDLHDGAQQRLVSLALQLRAAQATVPPALEELGAELEHVAAGLTSTLDELREFARGIHPAILAEGGLGPALKALARRSAVAVDLKVGVETRLPERIEVAAYYVVSEALTNAAKHAEASAVQVDVEAADGILRVSVRDDGVGGASFAGGSGLVGLKDRVEALGGRISLESPRGAGTAIRVELPVPDGDGGTDSRAERTPR